MVFLVKVKGKQQQTRIFLVGIQFAKGDLDGREID
jgi:hypothetical protein